MFAGATTFTETITVRQKGLEETNRVLAQAKQDLERLTGEQKTRLVELRADDVDANLVEQGRLDLEAARMNIESADVDLQSLESVIKTAEAAIQQLQRQIQTLKSATGEDADRVRKEQLPTLEAELTGKEEILKLDRQRLIVLQELRSVAEQRHRLASEWSNIVQNHFNTVQKLSQKEALELVLSQFQNKIHSQRKKITGWRGELGSLTGDSTEIEGKRQLLEWRMQLAEERIRLYQTEIRVAELQSLREPGVDPQTGMEVPTDEIQLRLYALIAFQTDAEAVLSLLRRKEDVLQQLLSVTEKRSTAEWLKSLQTKDIQGLVQSYGGLTEIVHGLFLTALKDRRSVESVLSARIRADLLTRQTLPSTSEEWRTLGSDLSAFPEELGKKVAAAFGDFGQSAGNASALSWSLLLLFETGWLGLWLWGRRRLIGAFQAPETDAEISFGRSAALRVAVIIRKNFWLLLLSGGLAIAVSVFKQVPPGSVVLYALAALPPALGLGFQVMRFFLIETNPNAGIAQIRRFRIMATVLLLGGLYACVMVMTQVLTFSRSLEDLLERLFMVFLFVGMLPVFGLRQGAITGLSERLGEGYWMQIIRVLSLVVPLSFLIAAAMGLAGYVNLGWAAGKYISWLILVFIAWSVLHGLWDDLAASLKNRINLKVKNGLFWIQGVVDPIHRIGRLFLFVGAWFTLFFLYGWDVQSKPAQFLVKIWSWGLFDWGQTSIQVSSLVLLIVLVTAFVWLSRWIRQFTFRMMFRKVLDVGIRHSLSVFAQYGVVLLGFLFTLRYMGIDLTNLAIVAGALGVGMGFGLQNVANNFVSGLLLLLERPVRTGDVIRVADKEGEVTKIGIRAVTVKTWDNHEVIIPNSEIASKTFTNWTHSNFVVRTLFLVGVHYDTDPHHAIRVIRDVLRENENILEDQKPVVWLSDFGASSVDIHVHYFTDWRVRSPMSIKSKVLLRIWERFKEEGIQIPYPQQDVYLKEVPEALRRPSLPDASSGQVEQVVNKNKEKEDGSP